MPWCEPCGAFFNPNTLHADGTCPKCGAGVGDPAEATGDEEADEEVHAKVPWHFWVGVVAMVIYLGWRLVQGIIWLF